jgi:hypothetical protein
MRLSPAELRPGDYEELDTMEGQAFDEAFCVVEFECVQGRLIPKHFGMHEGRCN